MATIKVARVINGHLVFGPVQPLPLETLDGAPVPPQPVQTTATIVSYQTPILLGQASQVQAKILTGVPDTFRWQYLSGGAWTTAGEVPASHLTFAYQFPTVGSYPIRLQTLVGGVVTDQTGSPRIISVQPKPPDPPQPPMSTQITLRTMDGHYVCAELGGGPVGEVNATRTTAGPWETWTRLPQPDGRIALQTVNGFYLCAEDGGGGIVVANRTAIGPWECWRELPVSGGMAYHSDNGHLLCAEGGGGGAVNATRTAAGPWETFNAPVAPIPPEPGVARTGVVHLEGAHVVADDQGRHYFGGATLFWGPWAYRTDLGKLDRNLDTLAPGQLDWIRPLGHVIEPADFWGPRANDLTVAGNIEALGAYIDHCYTSRGLRQHLTIFGDTSYTPAIRSSIVDQVIALLRPRLERIFCVEIVNEAELLKPTPFPVAEAKDYAIRVKNALGLLTFVSSPVGDLCDAQQRIAGDTNTSGIEPHYSRSTTGTKGVWTPATQPWMGDGRFCSHVGPLIINGEPIGPNSSGTSDSDPTRLATMILVGGVGGLCSDCFHTGTGVRGIDDPVRGIPADFDGIPNLAGILEAERQARVLLNQFPDLQDWSRGSSTDGPFTIQTWPNDAAGVKGTLDRAYSSWSSTHSLTACVNIRETTTFTAKKAIHVSVRHAARCADEIVSIDLSTGQSFTLDASTPGAAIVGTFR